MTRACGWASQDKETRKLLHKEHIKKTVIKNLHYNLGLGDAAHISQLFSPNLGLTLRTPVDTSWEARG